MQRRKIASLEEQLTIRTGIEHEREEFEQGNEFAKNREMQKLIEKYCQELNDCHALIRKLKSRLLHSNDVEVRVLKFQIDTKAYFSTTNFMHDDDESIPHFYASIVPTDLTMVTINSVSSYINKKVNSLISSYFEIVLVGQIIQQIVSICFNRTQVVI